MFAGSGLEGWFAGAKNPRMFAVMAMKMGVLRTQVRPCTRITIGL